MRTALFFRQQRVDGGIRSGIELDGQVIASHFDPGPSDSDPSLVWYVDVSFRGDSVPTDSDEVIRWVALRHRAVSSLLRTLAADLSAGVDADAWPARKTRSLPGGVKLSVSCSATRRAESRAIASQLLDIAENWRHYVETLVGVASPR